MYFWVSTFICVEILQLFLVNGQFLNCNWVANLDCTTYSEFKECGSDGITYDNRCYFAKQQCKDSDLRLLHDGACLPSEVSTTPAPGGGTDGGEAVLDFFCTSLSHRDCGTEKNEVCGSDNWTYLNYCEYDKARCTHRNLHVKNFGPCV
ncbi:hypothetical protein ACF0H5_003778 [Mactra antiquata]